MDEPRATTAWVVEHGGTRYLRETEDEARELLEHLNRMSEADRRGAELARNASVQPGAIFIGWVEREVVGISWRYERGSLEGTVYLKEAGLMARGGSTTVEWEEFLRTWRRKP